MKRAAAPTRLPPAKKSPADLTLDNTVVVILGRRGEGKTTLARTLAQGFPRVFVMDCRWQWEDDGYELGYVLEDFSRLIRPHPMAFRACYRPRFAQTDFPAICKAFETVPELMETLFVVDEVLKVSTRHELPPWWDDLIHFSRHQKVGIVVTTQRPTDLHGDIRAEASHIFCFRQHHPRDIAWLADVMGPEAERVKTLPEFKALCWNKGEIVFPVDNTTLQVVKSS